MTKILIADDETNIRMLAAVMFKDLGMEVITAENGEIAVDLAKQEKPDLIITDVIMPKKNGFEVCRTIRNLPELAQTPIIILSAMGDEYNKITGFEEGADDYVTKPFNVEELKARVKALLIRYTNYKDRPPSTSGEQADTAPETSIEQILTGHPKLDESLFGGFPKGSNILVLGPVGKGKSSFARQFIGQGLANKEKSLYVAVDDDPVRVRRQLSFETGRDTSEYESEGYIRFVDAYSWSSFSPNEEEAFAVTGALELNQLSGVISDASYDLGQTVQRKGGGRRVIDSISSLLVNFELPAVQRFLSQISRTAISFGGVTTLFIMEAGTVPDQVVNNIKYIMDGIVEFDEVDGKRAVRVSSMKWAKYTKEWKFIE